MSNKIKKRKLVSILINDLSSNAIVRTFPIAKTLSEKYNIEIIGPVLGKEIFIPYRNEFNFRIVKKNKGHKIFSAFSIIKQLMDYISGDIIYAFKPKITSFGVGLLVSKIRKIPIILDIEDLETDRWNKRGIFNKLKLSFERFDFYNEYFNNFCEKLISFADHKIVVSKLLKKKYGGTIIVHGVNTKVFDPVLYIKDDYRERLNLEKNIKYIIFSGLPREHKGIEELIKAIIAINLKNLKLLIVGGDIQDSYYKKLLSIGGDFIINVGQRPHKEMPAFLAASDIVVLPQRKTSFAMAQVPGKVFEAMAMAKPIIATNVSDLEIILKDCGIVIESSIDTTELENKIKMILNDVNFATTLGEKAREKCEAEYSWDQMKNKLFPIFDKYLKEE